MLKQIQKIPPFCPYGLMSLQAGAVHSITQHAEAGASSLLKSFLEEFPMQHCNRQQAQTNSQVAMVRLPVDFIFSQPCYVWQIG